MAEAQKIITSSDVHLFYGKFEALKGINLDFNEHEITALIGPSGCGKSTYLRTLNRMNDLIPGVTITGTISLRGQNIYAPSEDVVQLRKQVGMVFQQPNPFPFSIYENVIYGLRLAGVKDKSILDEAVETSLKQAAIWDEVKDHLHDQYTIILVTHSMHQASRISDKTAFFLTGNLIEFADTKQMFLNPKEKETEDYITGRFG